jgi:hypothetical protein
MKRKRRSAAQKAATQRMLAANRRKHHVTRNPANPAKRRSYKARRRYHNPSPVRHHRRRYRNPGLLSGLTGQGSILKELLSLDGALMVGASIAAPMSADWVQQMVMPSATGYTKLAVKAGVILLGAWAIHKFLKKPKVALAYGVTGSAVLAYDAYKIFTGTLSGLSAAQADALAMNPDNARMIATAGYRRGLSDSGYRPALADSSFNVPFNSPFRNRWVPVQ